MKNIAALLLALGSIFIIQYEGYYWSPCDGDICYSINCPDIRGCYTPPDRRIFDKMRDVEDYLNQNGTDHLIGIWEVDLASETVNKLGVTHKIGIKAE